MPNEKELKNVERKLVSLNNYVTDIDTLNKTKFKQTEEALFKMEEILGIMNKHNINIKKDIHASKSQIEELIYSKQNNSSPVNTDSSETFFKAYIEDAFSHERSKLKHTMQNHLNKEISKQIKETKSNNLLMLFMGISIVNLLCMIYILIEEVKIL